MADDNAQQDFRPEERELGLDSRITRRDFLNATLLGAGGALLGARSPAEADIVRSLSPSAAVAGSQRADEALAFEGPGGVGDYVRSHGNMFDMVKTAHEMRDGKFAGALANVHDTGETFDVIVVGGGASGLGAAYEVAQHTRGSCLLLDNHPMWGGEAKRNEFLVDGVRLIGPQGSNQCGVLGSGRGPAFEELWREIGLSPRYEDYMYEPWADGIQPLEIPRDNYGYQLWNDEFSSHAYFFGRNSGDAPVMNAFGRKLEGVPWPDEVKRDMLRARTDPRNYFGSASFKKVDPLSPMSVTTIGDDVKRWLDSMTYEDYLVKVMGLNAAVARYIDPRMAGAIGLGCDVLSAYAAFQIALPGMQAFRGDVPDRRLAAAPPGFTSFPGGNDALARHIVKRLVPGAITGARSFDDVMNNRVRFEALDRPGQAVRIRLGSTVVRVAERTGTRAGGTVEVVYSKGGRLNVTRGRGVVMANGGWTSRHVVRDLPESHVRAFDDFVKAPMLVVNVALHQWRFLYDQGITAVSYEDDFGFTCNVRQSMIVGRQRQPLHPDKPIVLTFYVPFSRPGKPLRDQAAGARTEILGTSYRQYETTIRSLMTRLFVRSGFDARRDIAGIILNRWGHAYVCPAPGFYTGRDGRRAAPDILREPLGRVAFANAELNGHQHFRIAMEEGWRAVRQVAGRA